ncbi:hypothetical protein K469DRAFT_685157 [Zopfia rhizophila CBS 207.26]|uniref:CCHC-type domain-containing protein n=1 Tax=Zopfia rhizophila CBS 207.26 TaxID=1314779 RepID=A0A6A6D7A7_9PEZI|nr:hypothetical protein K469DRAFT_685157 [Zopfia rhizophila CBS 207.26]
MNGAGEYYVLPAGPMYRNDPSPTDPALCNDFPGLGARPEDSHCIRCGKLADRAHRREWLNCPDKCFLCRGRKHYGKACPTMVYTVDRWWWRHRGVVGNIPGHPHEPPQLRTGANTASASRGGFPAMPRGGPLAVSRPPFQNVPLVESSNDVPMAILEAMRNELAGRDFSILETGLQAAQKMVRDSDEMKLALRKILSASTNLGPDVLEGSTQMVLLSENMLQNSHAIRQKVMSWAQDAIVHSREERPYRLHANDLASHRPLAEAGSRPTYSDIINARNRREKAEGCANPPALTSVTPISGPQLEMSYESIDGTLSPDLRPSALGQAEPAIPSRNSAYSGLPGTVRNVRLSRHKRLGIHNSSSITSIGHLATPPSMLQDEGRSTLALPPQSSARSKDPRLAGHHIRFELEHGHGTRAHFSASSDARQDGRRIRSGPDHGIGMTASPFAENSAAIGIEGSWRSKYSPGPTATQASHRNHNTPSFTLSVNTHNDERFTASSVSVEPASITEAIDTLIKEEKENGKRKAEDTASGERHGKGIKVEGNETAAQGAEEPGSENADIKVGSVAPWLRFALPQKPVGPLKEMSTSSKLPDAWQYLPELQAEIDEQAGRLTPPPGSMSRKNAPDGITTKNEDVDEREHQQGIPRERGGADGTAAQFTDCAEAQYLCEHFRRFYEAKNRPVTEHGG